MTDQPAQTVHIRPEIAVLPPYKQGRQAAPDALKLSSNENPFPPLPSVVDGKIVWLLDGYTTSDKYPLAEKKSLQEMTSDAVNPRSAYATLPTDNINYMRNAVKATVDAYDGTVTLYEWDTSDPVLKTWEKAFPGVVKKKSKA